VAAATGAAAGAVGALVSAVDRDAATGPVVVVAVTLAAIGSVVLAVARGRRRVRSGASRRAALRSAA
jgi:hypothetical protein